MGFEVVNEGTEEGGYVDFVPSVAEDLSWGKLGGRAAVEAEIDEMTRALGEFWRMEPDQVGRMIQAMSARCTELAILLHRSEHRREFRQIRTMQINPLLDEFKRQWAISSRLVEMRRQDIDLMR